MIESAVAHIAAELNQHLKRRFEAREDVVVVSNLLEQDGSLATNIGNRLVVFLVNVEKETTAHGVSNGKAPGIDSRVVSFPPLYLNLHVMVAAHFEGGHYDQALRLLSDAITFFQSRPVFDHAGSPGLSSNIERLVVDIESLTLNQLSNLWGMLGGRYLPSVLYKVRMVTIDSGDIRKRTPLVRQPEIVGPQAE